MSIFTRSTASLLLGIVIFAGLMAVRSEIEPVWLRAVVAAGAGCVFGWVFFRARNGNS